MTQQNQLCFLPTATLPTAESKETLRQQRAVLRTLRKNHPRGENRVVLSDGVHARYEQGTHKGHMIELYKLPCTEDSCHLDALFASDIDAGTTRALWALGPGGPEPPPPHHH